MGRNLHAGRRRLTAAESAAIDAIAAEATDDQGKHDAEERAFKALVTRAREKSELARGKKPKERH